MLVISTLLDPCGRPKAAAMRSSRLCDLRPSAIPIGFDGH